MCGEGRQTGSRLGVYTMGESILIRQMSFSYSAGMKFSCGISLSTDLRNLIAMIAKRCLLFLSPYLRGLLVVDVEEASDDVEAVRRAQVVGAVGRGQHPQVADEGGATPDGGKTNKK